MGGKLSKTDNGFFRLENISFVGNESLGVVSSIVNKLHGWISFKKYDFYFTEKKL